MTKEEFLALPKPEAVKVAWKMYKNKKINMEQFSRMIKALDVAERSKTLWGDAVEVFDKEEK
jgi:hypothetical protein